MDNKEKKKSFTTKGGIFTDNRGTIAFANDFD
jgi:hypothetical protein